MQRSEDAAIPMRQDFDRIRYLVGNREILKGMKNARALPLFSDKALDFLDSLSGKLMTVGEAKKYPDVIAYAFWIRRASLEKAGARYRTGGQKMGRGIAFQIAPSNIPVQFAVSLTYALIAGNASIVRVSDKAFAQTDIICRAVRAVLEDVYPEMAPYICVLRYHHNDEITQALTDLCDIRMIWGGDHTIAAVRKATITARCIDLGFADRYSFTVMDSDGYLKKDAVLLANGFYNDTYFSDQNACSSPRLIIWTGSKIAEAKEVFWDALEKVVAEKYRMNPICSSEKLLKTAVCAAKHPGIREIKKNNLLVRVELPSPYDDIMDYRGNCGYFFECSVESLQDIVPLMKKECQTITFAGEIEGRLRKIIGEYGVRGVDRIVPVGHAADIAFVWDGVDLPNILSRQIGNA